MKHRWIRYSKDSDFSYCELCGLGSVNAPLECAGAKFFANVNEMGRLLPQPQRGNKRGIKK